MLSNELLLQNDGKTYLKILEEAEVQDTKLQKDINTTEYNSWEGSHLHCLCYLVGELDKTYDEDTGELITEFYGALSKIDQTTGILILKKLCYHGIDIHIKNYYNETALECIKKDTLTNRTNNEKFIKELEKLYE
jgi:hypothetical protein